MDRTSAAQKGGDPPPSAPARVFRFSTFELDARSGELRRSGLRVRLPNQAFRTLELLLSRPGEVVTREELRQRLWGADTFVDFEVGLNNAVRKLRDALGDSAGSPRFIETLPRHGYRFIGALQPITENADTLPEPPAAAGARKPGTIRLAAALAALLLLAALGVGWRRLSQQPPEPAIEQIRSLAVLPFENLTGDASQEYLADGLTDALTTHLAKIETLNVVSHTTAKQYGAAAMSAPDIGRELNVDAMVQGAVMRSGNHLRINARLILAGSDRHAWASAYDGELGNILSLQWRIASDVASEIGRPLPPLPADHTRRSRSVDPEAADAYLKGVFSAGRGEYEGMRTAVAYFEEAIARQPDYAEAHAVLAQAQFQFLFMGPLSPRQVIPRAEAAARKAIELDETAAQPHQTLSRILTVFYWKWDEGREELRRARELAADSRAVAATSGHARHTRPDAIAEALRERDRDPRSLQAQLGVALAYRTAGEHERAIPELERALEMAPGHARAQFLLGTTYLLIGRRSDAIPWLEVAVRPVGGNPRFLAYLGYAYATAGRTAEARRVLSDLVSRRRTEYVSSFGIALIHDALGEREPALIALERAYEDRAVEFSQMSQYPPFKTIGSDPRFDALMRRIGRPR